MPYHYRCNHVSWYDKGPVAKDLDHVCSKCSICINNKHFYDPTQCVACSGNLRRALKSGTEAEHAWSHFGKWDSTMVNEWHKTEWKLIDQFSHLRLSQS